MVPYLNVGLRVSGHIGLPWGLQERLPGREEWPCVSGSRLVEVKDPHGALRLNVRPDQPLPGKDRLLALLREAWSRLAERKRILAGNRMAAVQKRWWRRRRRTPLLK